MLAGQPQLAFAADEVKRPTAMPRIVSCSDSQRSRLEDVYKRAHTFVWRAQRFADALNGISRTERERLWRRERIDRTDSVSPHTWFGPYDGERSNIMREGLKKAEQRFRRVGNVKIRELRCGQPIAASANEHTDVCPAVSTGGGWPNAFHAPPGIIMTCPSFWNAMDNQFQDPEVRKDDAAMTLVHEVFHWLSIDDCPSRRVTCVKYVTDYHGDGAGGIPDRFWKGADRSRELARRSPRHATRNNDNYANFIRNVATSKPYVHGIWERRSGGSEGDYSHAHMLPWDSFVAHWEIRARDFELVDISTYVHFGTRLYSGLWHGNPGRNGALFYLTSWQEFEGKWRELQPTQELVDIEVFKDGDHLSYIGVWRVRDAGDRNVGALYSGLTWDEFVARWTEVPKWQYLADIEAYHDVDGRLRFAGVWRARPDPSDRTPNSLWRFNGMQAFTDFTDHARQIASGNTLVDVERFYDNGQEVYVGAWRGGGNSGALWFARDADVMSRQMRLEDNTQLMTRLNFDLDLPMRMK